MNPEEKPIEGTSPSPGEPPVSAVAPVDPAAAEVAKEAIDNAVEVAPKPMLFLNNEQVPGMHTTVRLGRAWCDRLNIGDNLVLRHVDGAGPEYNADIVLLHRCLLRSVPQWAMDMEHDPSCQTKDGLWQAMCRAYKDEVAPDYEVTVVGYEVTAEA